MGCCWRRSTEIGGAEEHQNALPARCGDGGGAEEEERRRRVRRRSTASLPGRRASHPPPTQHPCLPSPTDTHPSTRGGCSSKESRRCCAASMPEWSLLSVLGAVWRAQMVATPPVSSRRRAGGAHTRRGEEPEPRSISSCPRRRRRRAVALSLCLSPPRPTFAACLDSFCESSWSCACRGQGGAN